MGELKISIISNHQLDYLEEQQEEESED